MNTATQEKAYWEGHILTRLDNPLIEKYAKVPPTEDTFCYWCAIGGQCFALAPVAPTQSAIASVQHALMATDMPRQQGGWIDTDVCYVIWQPKNHGVSAWQRWSRKWSARTAIN
jgi:hypothetical protein